MSAYSTPHSFPLSEFVYDANSIYNLDCGKVSRKLYLSKTALTAPDWMSVSDQQITLSFKNQTSAYNKAIDLFVSLEEYPFVNTTTTFNVTLTDSECGMNHSPYFKPNISEIISLQMTNSQQNWVYKLPQIVDEDSGDVVRLTVDLGYAADFANLRENK